MQIAEPSSAAPADSAPAPSDTFDYLEVLRREFSERCRSNPRYSLRAFARDLRLSPAMLSYVLSGRKGLSIAAARGIAERIGLTTAERQLFCASVEAKHGRSRTSRAIGHSKMAQLMAEGPSRSLSLDAFQVISDWHHLAILQMLELRGFSSDPKWIGARLGVHPKEIEMAIGRLIRLKLLERARDGKLRAPENAVFAPDGVPSEAIRKFHRQVLERALATIAALPMERRYLNSTVLPVRDEDRPRAIQRIKDFQKRFDREFSVTDGTADGVSVLAIQFFDALSEAAPPAAGSRK